MDETGERQRGRKRQGGKDREKRKRWRNWGRVPLAKGPAGILTVSHSNSHLLMEPFAQALQGVNTWR